METNNLFQSYTDRGQSNSYQNNNNINWSGYQNTVPQNQQLYYTGGFTNRSSSVSPPSSNIPVRVIFSPEQIAPQEIPTNGTPALFPLNDGSKIIAKYLLGNGLFDERIYVLQPKNYNENAQNPQPSEFDQVMKRLEGIEDSLNKVLGDLYGTKTQTNQEGVANNE